MKIWRFLVPVGALALVFGYGSLTGFGAPPQKAVDKDKVADKQKSDKTANKDLQQKEMSKEFPKSGTTGQATQKQQKQK
jgi:hypothetical protein